jgi:hypothetical protein
VATWIPCGEGFIDADVVRWTEAVWKRGRRKGRRAVRVGARSVTAQVARIDTQGWVALHVIESRVTEEAQGRSVAEVFANGQELRRKRSTMTLGIRVAE